MAVADSMAGACPSDSADESAESPSALPAPSTTCAELIVTKPTASVPTSPSNARVCTAVPLPDREDMLCGVPVHALPAWIGGRQGSPGSSHVEGMSREVPTVADA